MTWAWIASEHPVLALSAVGAPATENDGIVILNFPRKSLPEIEYVVVLDVKSHWTI